MSRIDGLRFDRYAIVRVVWVRDRKRKWVGLIDDACRSFDREKPGSIRDPGDPDAGGGSIDGGIDGMLDRKRRVSMGARAGVGSRVVVRGITRFRDATATSWCVRVRA